MLLRAKPFPVSFLIHSSFYSHLPAYEDGTECSETSAYKPQTPGSYTKESIQQFMLLLHSLYALQRSAGRVVICFALQIRIFTLFRSLFSLQYA